MHASHPLPRAFASTESAVAELALPTHCTASVCRHAFERVFVAGPSLGLNNTNYPCGMEIGAGLDSARNTLGGDAGGGGRGSDARSNGEETGQS